MLLMVSVEGCILGVDWGWIELGAVWFEKGLLQRVRGRFEFGRLTQGGILEDAGRRRYVLGLGR